MTYALDIQNLCKTYASGVVALNDASFKVQSGDFFALLGPNGAGKSTTLGIISSLVNKTSGQVKIMGYDLDHELVQAKMNLGVVPQEFNFNQFEKVLDIVVTQAGYYGIPASVATERADHYLKRLGLWEKRSTPARMLSGGMKRRLMIARALIHEPKVLLLDEPTAGVDIELRRSMWQFLQEMNRQGTTIILTTHYLEEAEALCRNIVIIDRGKILENTSKKALLEKLSLETFVLETSTSAGTISEVGGFSFRAAEEGTLEVDVPKGQSINALFKLLSELGVEVRSIRSKSNRLEELFVKLVEGNAPERKQ